MSSRPREVRIALAILAYVHELLARSARSRTDATGQHQPWLLDNSDEEFNARIYQIACILNGLSAKNIKQLMDQAACHVFSPDGEHLPTAIGEISVDGGTQTTANDTGVKYCAIVLHHVLALALDRSRSAMEPVGAPIETPIEAPVVAYATLKQLTCLGLLLVGLNVAIVSAIMFFRL